QGDVQVQVYKQGKITRLSDAGIIIQELTGEDQVPVRGDLDILRKAPRGEYTVYPGGQTVKNPDYILVQPGELTSTKGAGTPNGIWNTQEKGLMFPAVCVCCGAEDRALNPWRI